jgi:aspartate/glutamate racemase
MSQRSITFVHTSPAAIAPLARFYADKAPDLQVTNMLDDAILRFFRTGDGERARRSLIAMIDRGVSEYEAEAILLTCSSVTLDMIADLSAGSPVPLIKIDLPMAEAAVRAASNIGVVVSFPPTEGPTTRLIRDAAAAAGREVRVMIGKEPEAYDALLKGDIDTHDRLISARAHELFSDGADAIVLAQVSMGGLQARLSEEIPVPVLSSLDTSLRAVREALA